MLQLLRLFAGWLPFPVLFPLPSHSHWAFSSTSSSSSTSCNSKGMSVGRDLLWLSTIHLGRSLLLHWHGSLPLHTRRDRRDALCRTPRRSFPFFFLSFSSFLFLFFSSFCCCMLLLLLLKFSVLETAAAVELMREDVAAFAERKAQKI